MKVFATANLIQEAKPNSVQTHLLHYFQYRAMFVNQLLDCSVQALIQGGNAESIANANSAGGSNSWVFDVSPGGNHTLIQEQTAFPRVV